MGIVNHDEKRLALVHALEPARHARQGSNTLLHFIRSNAQAQGCGGGRHNVIKIRAADQPRLDFQFDLRRHYRGLESLQALAKVLDLDLGVGIEPVSDPAGVREIEQSRAPRVVQIDHGQFRRRRSQTLEEPPLGLEITLKVLVIIEVVARQVGEHGGRETQSPDALLRQGVRRDFHDDSFAARRHQLGKIGHQIERFGRRIDGRKRPAAPPVLDGAKQAGEDAGGLENAFEQIRRGGLAVRTRNTHEPEARVRVSVKGAGGRRQGATNPPDANPARRQLPGRIALADHRYGPAS